jgi:hypothetical protein
MKSRPSFCERSLIRHLRDTSAEVEGLSQAVYQLIGDHGQDHFLSGGTPTRCCCCCYFLTGAGREEGNNTAWRAADIRCREVDAHFSSGGSSKIAVATGGADHCAGEVELLSADGTGASRVRLRRSLDQRHCGLSLRRAFEWRIPGDLNTGEALEFERTRPVDLSWPTGSDVIRRASRHYAHCVFKISIIKISGERRASIGYVRATSRAPIGTRHGPSVVATRRTSRGSRRLRPTGADPDPEARQRECSQNHEACNDPAHW